MPFVYLVCTILYLVATYPFTLVLTQFSSSIKSYKKHTKNYCLNQLTNQEPLSAHHQLEAKSNQKIQNKNYMLIYGAVSLLLYITETGVIASVIIHNTTSTHNGN